MRLQSLKSLCLGKKKKKAAHERVSTLLVRCALSSCYSQGLPNSAYSKADENDPLYQLGSDLSN